MAAVSAAGLGDRFVLTLFTNDPAIARRAEAAGIARIGPDLERIGKAARQQNLDTWQSTHEEADVARVGAALVKAELFVRINSPHPGLGDEIDRVIAMGARSIMLPFFDTADEVRTFVDRVGGRARTVLLVETARSATIIDDIVAIDGVDEVHVGLNDLRLSLGVSGFEVMASPLLVKVSAAVRGAGMPFGFGRIGRPDDRSLPVDPDLVYAQYPRLMADRAFVSRYFLLPDPDRIDLVRSIADFRARMNDWASRDSVALEAARIALLAAATRAQVAG
ncbi:MAG: aldolase/citrate lyase family protein [Dongiaceae bacterium]